MKSSVIFLSGFSVFMCNIIVHKIINSILQSCTYVLSQEGFDTVCLVDCGDIKPICDYLEKKEKRVESVFLTHAHYDHVYGLKDLLVRYPDIKVYGNRLSLDGLEDDNFTLSYLYEDSFMVSLDDKNAFPVIDNHPINVLGEDGYCIATPGHDVDCMTYIIGNMIFTGDSYNPHSEVFTKWTRSNADEAGRSMMKILNLISENHLIVYPGHQID